MVRAGLLKLGLVTDAASKQYRTWYTHGICHWIGIDVHDVGDYRRPLEPGMAFVIEPGLYIREQALDALPRHGGEPRLQGEGPARRSRSTRTSACGSRTRSCSPRAAWCGVGAACRARSRRSSLFAGRD